MSIRNIGYSTFAGWIDATARPLACSSAGFRRADEMFVST